MVDYIRERENIREIANVDRLSIICSSCYICLFSDGVFLLHRASV